MKLEPTEDNIFWLGKVCTYTMNSPVQSFLYGILDELKAGKTVRFTAKD